MSDVLSECSEASCTSDFDDECKSYNFDISNGSPIDTENFIIVHYNINSILAMGKLDQLTDYDIESDILIFILIYFRTTQKL